MHASSAQAVSRTAPSAGTVVSAAFQLNVTSHRDHARFWGDTLDGTWHDAGPTPSVRWRNVWCALDKRPPTGGTKGTPLDHIAFAVPDVRAALGRVRAAGFRVVTREECPPAAPVEDDVAHIVDQDLRIAFVMGPDEVKVELLQPPAAPADVALHHFHLFCADVEAMRSWYVRTLRAVPRRRGAFKTADLPGAQLTFSPSRGSLVRTRGRVVDRIRFGVAGLEAVLRRLGQRDEDLARRTGEESGGAGVAREAVTLFDPDGTAIELTEDPAPPS